MKKSSTIFKSIRGLAICMLFSASVNAQLSGVYNVPGNYANVGSAIAALNSYGVNGPVTINIAAGLTETVPVGGFTLTNVVGSSSLNTITFQKSGAGANPLITAYAGGVGSSSLNTQDAIWRFEGTDFVTIDGIDLVDPNTANPATMEYGYVFLKANANNGCQNNTIKNCVITLNRINNDAGAGPVQPGSKGIAMINATSSSNTVALTVLSAAGANSNNKFYSNTIQNCNTGITLIGYAAASPYTFADWNNDIGGSSVSTGNMVYDFGAGGTANQSNGIICGSQYNFNVSFNRVNNNTLGTGANHANTIRCIGNLAAPEANATLNSNTLTLIANVTTATVSVLENFAGNGGTTNTISIQDNIVTGCSFPSITTASLCGIANQGAAANVIIDGNKFINNSTTGTSGNTIMIYNSSLAASTNYVSMSNNQLSFSFVGTAVNTGVNYAIYNLGGSATASLNVSNNDFSSMLFTTPATSAFYFINNGTGFYSATFNNNTFSNLTMYHAGGHGLISNSTSTQKMLSVTNNSIIGTYSRTGTNSTMYCYISSGASSLGTSTQVFSGNNFSNISSTIAGAGTFYGIYSSDGSASPYPRKMVYNNVISNVNFNTTGAVYGIFMNYLGDGSGTSGSEVYNNTITNFTTNASSPYGLYVSSTSSPNYRPRIYNNEVSNLYNTAAAGVNYGLYLTANTTIGVELYKNKIYGISSSGATATSYGLYVAGGANTLIHNNLIGNINASASSGLTAVNGIYVNAGTSYTLAFNSVNLNATSSAANFGSNAIYLNTTPNVVLQNNIFVNTSTPNGTGITAALRRSSTTLTTYGSTSNNNLFYAGTPSANRVIYYDGTSVQQTLANFKTLAAGRDAASVTENPTFLSTVGSSPNYLNISPSVTTQIESGATYLSSFPTDYIGTTRASIPDIGAWEGNYLPNPVDLYSPVLVGSGFISSACNLSARTLTVGLTDVSGIATGSLSPLVYYKVNSGTYSSAAGVLSSGTASAGVWTFSLNYTALVNDVISYYIVAQDAFTTPNLMASPSAGFAGTDVNTISTPPTTPNTYTVNNALSGTYSVGIAGTFTTMTAAANAYNNSCLAGPVTFVLSDATYPNETYPITFSNNIDASSTNSLLIVPASAVSVAITGTSTTAPALIKLHNARYITIDGLNTGGSSLTFSNISTSTSANIWLASGSTLGVKNIAIKNSTMIGTTYTSSISYGINASIDGASPSATGGADNDNVTIQGNTILRAYRGIYAIGTANYATGGLNNWIISGNKVGPSTSGTDNIGYSGINLSNTQLSTISNNTIANVSFSISYPNGITLGAGVNTTTISNNYISSIKHTGTNSGGLGIDLQTSEPNSGIKINNNMIWDISGDANASFTSGGFAGIAVGRLGLPGAVSIEYNTIVMNQGSAVAGYNGAALTAAVYIGTGNNHIVRNNILYSNITYTNTGAKTYALYSAIPASAYTIIDNNDYYVSGTQGALAYLTSSLATLANIQTSFGQNVNSMNLQPTFMSSTNMHKDPAAAGNYLLDNKGQVIAGITTDIDNVSRNGSTPDVGADEFTSTAVCNTPMGGTLTSTSYTTCSTNTITLTSNGFSSGANTIYEWQISTTPGGPYTNVSTGTGSNTNVYTALQAGGGVYYYVLKATCTTNSLFAVSNEATVTVIAAPVLSISSSPSVVCSAANTATLMASGATTYTWNNGIVSNSIVVNPTNSANYFVIGNNIGCSNVISNNFALLYGITPTVTASYATPSVCAFSQATLNASGATSYTWDTGMTGTSINPTPSVLTVYTVTASDVNSNGCVSQATVEMGVYPLPVINVSGSSGICTGQTASLTASGATTYSWNTGATTNSITDTPSSNTTYTVIGTDALGCSTTTTQLVTVAGSLSITIAGPTSVCDGQSAVLTGMGGVTYTWNTGATTATIAVNPTVTTTYSIIGASGTCSNTSSSALTVNSNPTVAISGSLVICNGNTTTLTASGANNYTWTTGATLPSVNVSPTVNTNYSVIGTNVAGCSSSASVAVVSNSLPVITIAQSNTAVCVSSPVSFTASGAATYSWVGGPNTDTFITNPASASVYTVNATNAQSCSSSKTVSVGMYANPVLTISPASSTVCSLSVANFTVSGASTYTWNGTMNGATVSFTPVSNSVYSVSATSTAGCIGNGTVAVTTNSLPVVSIAPASPTVCALSPTQFTASGASTYTWNNNSSSTGSLFSTLPANSSVYTVTGTSSQGCISSQTVGLTALALPNVVVTPSLVTVCENTSATYTVTGANTYTWANGSNASTVIITPSVNTSFSVVGTDANGCTNNGQVVLITNPSPTITVLPVSATVCPFVSKTFTASGANTYTWSTGPSTTVCAITASATSVYSVMGEDVNGCLSTQTLSIYTKPTPSISITSSSASVCIGAGVTYSASGATSYTWSTGAIAPLINVTATASTVYTVNGIGTNGCASNASVNLHVWNNPTILISPIASTICAGETVTLTASGATTYTWYPFNSTGSVFSHNFLNTTNCNITAVDVNGCEGSTTYTVFVKKCTGIAENEQAAANISVYPNPSSGLVTIDLNFEGKKNIVITNATGAVISEMSTEQVRESFDLTNYAKGIYFVRVDSKVSNANFKIIIQ